MNNPNMSRDHWVMSNPTIVNYNQPVGRSSFGLQHSNLINTPIKPGSSPQVAEKYNPFVEDDMEIVLSDDENPDSAENNVETTSSQKKASKSTFGKELVEVQSGAAFYKGLILYIPPFEQVANTYRGSPAMKMLYASFEFSFKMPIRIETKMNPNGNNMGDATVMFRDEVLATGSGWAPHVVASVRSLELLSETCYTIQAKEDYYTKCKLIDAETMKTLNLKKWEAVSEKYPKLVDITKDSHIQKTFSVFLDGHTGGGAYEDIVICNLTRQNVSDIKKVVEFFHLTMLPCSVSTKVAKKATPCVVSIHKYTSAQKLLNILIECGGENDNFILYPPDTFKDFYKLHYSFWDLSHKKPEVVDAKTTLDDEELQELVMKPYENMISELFEKYKLLGLPKIKEKENSDPRKVGDDFMKETFKIDMANSKNLAPVERMQLLLKYMEQLQEYGSRVLNSGRPEMIKIYHNAIENLRKDLDTCRKDIEKEQKEKSSGSSKDSGSKRSRSPQRRRPMGRSPVHIKSRSPVHSSMRSISPKRRGRSRSPKRPERPRKSLSPKRRPKSPKRAHLERRYSPPKRDRSPPKRSSPTRRPRSPRQYSTLQTKSPPPSSKNEDFVIVSIFKDQFRRFVEALRRFRIEIEDTPIERRSTLKDKLLKSKDQLKKFYIEAMGNRTHLGEYLDEMVILREEIDEQEDLIAGKPGPNDLPRSITPPPWMAHRPPAGPRPMSTAYPLPGPRYDGPPSWGQPQHHPGFRPPPMHPPPYGYPY